MSETTSDNRDECSCGSRVDEGPEEDPIVQEIHDSYEEEMIRNKEGFLRKLEKKVVNSSDAQQISQAQQGREQPSDHRR